MQFNYIPFILKKVISNVIQVLNESNLPMSGEVYNIGGGGVLRQTSLG